MFSVLLHALIRLHAQPFHASVTERVSLPSIWRISKSIKLQLVICFLMWQITGFKLISNEYKKNINIQVLVANLRHVNHFYINVY